MLILTRWAGEALRIGIKAPRDVTLDREEIAERKRRDRESNAVKQGRLIGALLGVQ
jgi:sRNA-binding carbon storage regulator CsrA